MKEPHGTVAGPGERWYATPAPERRLLCFKLQPSMCDIYVDAQSIVVLTSASSRDFGADSVLFTWSRWTVYAMESMDRMKSPHFGPVGGCSQVQVPTGGPAEEQSPGADEY